MRGCPCSFHETFFPCGFAKPWIEILGSAQLLTERSDFSKADALWSLASVADNFQLKMLLLFPRIRWGRYICPHRNQIQNLTSVDKTMLWRRGLLRESGGPFCVKDASHEVSPNFFAKLSHMVKISLADELLKELHWLGSALKLRGMIPYCEWKEQGGLVSACSKCSLCWCCL